jgi:hypothetical protein
MDPYDKRNNLGKKNLANIVATYGRGRELFRQPTCVLSVRANRSFRKSYIQLFITTCFRRFWPLSGRFYKDIYGKEYLGGGLPFSVSTFQYVIHKI